MIWDERETDDYWDVDFDFPCIYTFLLNWHNHVYIAVEYYCPNYTDEMSHFWNMPAWWWWSSDKTNSLP